jgi:RNA polymerase sigma-70 factor (ECF subfamily)
MDIEALYNKYGPMVMRRCQQLLQDEEQALDITQDVFVQIIQRKRDLTVQYPSSLLYCIATNLSLNRIRDMKRHSESDMENMITHIAEFDDPAPRLEAQSILNHLFKRHQALTLEEVAREVGMSVSGVRKRLRVLRASLKEKE